MTSPGSGQEGGTGPKPPYPTKSVSHGTVTKLAAVIADPTRSEEMKNIARKRATRVV